MENGEGEGKFGPERGENKILLKHVLFLGVGGGWEEHPHRTSSLGPESHCGPPCPHKVGNKTAATVANQQPSIKTEISQFHQKDVLTTVALFHTQG
jgi:hypothetical protein